MDYKGLAHSINTITHIEKLGIFCFSAIIIVSIINWINYSPIIIFYSFFIVLHFLRVGFYRYENSETKIDCNNPKYSVNFYNTGFKFPKNEEENSLIKKLNIFGWFFFVVATLLLIKTLFYP